MQQVHKGRGATLNPAGRFERHGQEIVDDGWGTIEEVMAAPGPATTVQPDRSRTVIARNDSPDIGFDASINPYRGCEHALRSEGVQVAITYGDPDFYRGVGFAPITEEQARPPLPLSFPHGWIGQSLAGEAMPDLQGPSTCVGALNRSEVW